MNGQEPMLSQLLTTISAPAEPPAFSGLCLPAAVAACCFLKWKPALEQASGNFKHLVLAMDDLHSSFERGHVDLRDLVAGNNNDYPQMVNREAQPE